MYQLGGSEVGLSAGGCSGPVLRKEVLPRMSLISWTAELIWVTVVGPRVSSMRMLWMFWMLYRFTSSRSTSFSAYSSCRFSSRYSSFMFS